MSISDLVRDVNGVAESDGYQYLHGLVNEKQVSAGGVIKPAIPIGVVRRKGRIAGRLTKLTGGKIHVFYSPSSLYPDDREAQGHLFNGWWTTDDEAEFVCLDDREGPLEQQLAAECRRIAKMYSEVAETIEASTAALVERKAVANG
jgi:hypothetical protein